MTQYRGQKFDVVIGNPPYQAPRKESTGAGAGARGRLWDKFVMKALDDLVKDGGIVSLIHPAGWRSPDCGDLFKTMSRYHIKYANFNSGEQGQKTFGAGTNFDWYVLQKTKRNGITTISDWNNEEHKIKINEFPFIPNSEFDIFSKFIKNKPVTKILISSHFHSQIKDRVSEEKKKGFDIKVVHTTSLKGPRFTYCKSDDPSKGFVGIPKVVVSKGRNVVPFVDKTGEYGTSQHAFSIPVVSDAHADYVEKLINSEDFKKLVASTKWSTFATSKTMFEYVDFSNGGKFK